VESQASEIPRPAAPNFDAIPEELKQLPQWVVWRIEERGGKHTKVPVNPTDTLRRASSTDPHTWGTFKEAREAFETWHAHGRADGIGFIFTRKAGIVGIDFDHCRTGGEWDADVLKLALAVGSYTEISPSGEGLHVFAYGSIPGNRNRRGNVEIYEHGRFFTVTGAHLDGTPTAVKEAAPDSIEALYATIVGESDPTPAPAVKPTRTAPATDEEILERCRAAKNSEKFERLWTGDASGYASGSEADLALCSILAYQAGGDFGTVDRLFRRSGLFRDKWDERRGRFTYGQRTVQKAFSETLLSPRAGRSARPPAGEEREADPADLVTKDLNCTDLGNSERLVHRHGENLRFCFPWKAWLLWNGRAWLVDRAGRVNQYAKATARRIYDEAAAEEDDTRRGELSKWARTSEGEARVRAMLALAASDVSIPPELLDEDGNLFNAQNGTLELDTLTFREHRREDLLTKVAGVSYNPEATCPKFKAHLELIFDGDCELIEGLQMLLGYSLLDGNPEQVFNVFYGHGQNGKSVLLAVLRAVLGDYATHAAASTFMAQENDGRPRSDLLALKGARLVTATETEDNRRLAEGLVKASTGGDPITCRGLYREEETFLPSHMPVLATNHRPIIRGMDLAIWRRILLWPFEVTIPEKDRVPGYERELMAEGSGILNWLLEGLRRYQEAGRLAIPAKVRAATDQYRSDMDRLGPFLSEYFTSDPWPEDASRDVKCSKKEFSDLYKLWCTKYGVRIPLTDHQVKSTLEERGVESKRGEKGTHYWIGIRPKSADEIINDREEDGQ
jgi:putative DNA primase/helicase